MRLYAITDRRLLPGTHENGYLSDAEREGLVRLAGGWAALGVEDVQLREKDPGERARWPWRRSLERSRWAAIRWARWRWRERRGRIWRCCRLSFGRRVIRRR